MNIIDDLTSKINSTISTNINNNALFCGEKFIAINFISTDQRINNCIICKNMTKFH